MIEKMKMVHVVSTVSQKDEMLSGLRDLGLLHLAEKKSADRAATEKFANLAKVQSLLAEYAPDKKEAKKLPAAPVLSDEEFAPMYEEVQAAIDRKSALAQEMGFAATELERIKAWGNFTPADVKELKEQGYDFHFYRVTKAEYAEIVKNENIKAVRLKTIDKMDTIAVLGTLPTDIPASEFALPDKGVEELEQEMKACTDATAECDAILKKNSVYDASFQVQMLKAQNEENYSSASETAESDQDFVWISGYVPEADMDNFKAAAASNHWAWAEEDVADDDENIPTKVRYNKMSALIKPVFDILGILPGYREQDISLFFFLFFTLFFAMIIGDAGYGCLILIATIALIVKKKKMSNTIYLLLVLSIATIVWGAITGTWFGMEKAMQVPFLKAMVLPGFANYPEYFGLTSLQQQNNIMKFSFTIGAIQMALGSLLAIKKKIPEKNLSWIADLGWMIAIIAMYLLSLYLVIGENVPFKPIIVCVAVAFILVVVFGGMSPDKTFAQGIKSGCADAFTVFLNTISCFGNVMSYIRLFAVGMAGLAISQSFNGIAAGFHGPLIFMGIFVVIVGHALNIVMCFLSVVVHGVRLNVLEFSGQVGLEWTGIAYEPFKINEKIKK